MAAVTRKITIRPLEGDGVYGWSVTMTTTPPGRDYCVAMTCGGALGQALATMCARQVAEAYGVDEIEADDELIKGLLATKEAAE